MATIELTTEQWAEEAIATLYRLASEHKDRKFRSYIGSAVRRVELIVKTEKEK